MEINKKYNTIEFKWSIAKMNGHTSKCHGESTKSTQFTQTCEDLQQYTSVKYKFGGDMSQLIKYMKPITFGKLKEPTPLQGKDKASRTDEKI